MLRFGLFWIFIDIRFHFFFRVSLFLQLSSLIFLCIIHHFKECVTSQTANEWKGRICVLFQSNSLNSHDVMLCLFEKLKSSIIFPTMCSLVKTSKNESTGLGRWCLLLVLPSPQVFLNPYFCLSFFLLSSLIWKNLWL